VQFIEDFEAAVALEARSADVDGIVCGHIHHAELRTIDGVLYANTGDWVESCTALVEHMNGTLEIIHWTTIDHDTPRPPDAPDDHVQIPVHRLPRFHEAKTRMLP